MDDEFDLLSALTECERPLPEEARGPLGFVSECSLRVGDAANAAFDWTRDNFEDAVDGLRDGVERAVEGVVAVLQDPPNTGWLRDIPRREVEYLYPPDWHPFVILALMVLGTWLLHRRWTVTLMVLVGMLFVINQGYWDETTESITLVLFSCTLCMAIGVPIGIAAAHRPALYRAMRPVLDLMQTLPTFVYLIPAVVFFGVGVVPGLIATVIFVLPAPIRLTHLGISSTPKPLVEAVEAFGGTRRDVLWKAELPYAWPQIMTGLNQTIMLSLSMVVIAGLVGADGLGVPIVRALNSVNIGLGFESGFVIVVVAILLDRVLRVERR